MSAFRSRSFSGHPDPPVADGALGQAGAASVRLGPGPAERGWVDHRGHLYRSRDPEDVLRCPSQIGIVSTGLLVRGGSEAQALMRGTYGMIALGHDDPLLPADTTHRTSVLARTSVIHIAQVPSRNAQARTVCWSSTGSGRPAART